jgi:hypothetical protein
MIGRFRWLGLAAIAAAALTAIGCTSYLFGKTVRGEVVDGESRRPVEGAAARWSRRALCPNLFGYTTTDLANPDARTDGDGRFGISREGVRAPCAGPVISETLWIIAPGYHPLEIHDSGFLFHQEPVWSGRFELDHFRYRLEIEDLGSTSKSGSERRRHSASADRRGPRGEPLAARVRRRSPRDRMLGDRPPRASGGRPPGGLR